jgi:hypothetical protein
MTNLVKDENGDMFADSHNISVLLHAGPYGHVIYGMFVFDCSNIGITGLNPTRGTGVCPHFSVLCYPVQVYALCWADPLSKESYQMSID